MDRTWLLLIALLVGCTLEDVQLEGKRCPCAPGWFCVEGVCRKAPEGGALDASMDAARRDGDIGRDAGPDGGGAADGGSSDGGSSDGGSSGSYEATVLEDGPLAYWRFDESEGSTTARDRTSNGNDGSYLGGVTLGVAGVVEGNGAARFDGTSGRVVLGDRFDFPGLAAFSFEAWIRPEVLDTMHRRIVDKTSFPASGRQGYTIFVRAAGTEDGGTRSTVALERWRDMDLDGAPITDLAIPTDRFTHLVITYDGTRAKIFLDAVQVADEASSAALVDHSDPFVLGAQSNQSLSFYSGIMDEVAVYDHALTPERVAAHHAAAGGI